MKKKFIFFIFLVLTILSFSFSVFGVDMTTTKQIDVPNFIVSRAMNFSEYNDTNKKMYIIEKQQDTEYWVIFAETGSKKAIINSVRRLAFSNNGSTATDVYGVYYSITCEGNTITNVSSSNNFHYGFGAYNVGSCVQHDNGDGTVSLEIYSTDDVYGDVEQNLFFFRQMSHLAKVVKGVETNKVLQEVVLLLPTILVVVVSFLGFRKAWALLARILHRA